MAAKARTICGCTSDCEIGFSPNQNETQMKAVVLFDEQAPMYRVGIRPTTGVPYVAHPWSQASRPAAAALWASYLHPLRDQAQARAVQSHAPSVPEPEVQP